MTPLLPPSMKQRPADGTPRRNAPFTLVAVAALAGIAMLAGCGGDETIEPNGVRDRITLAPGVSPTTPTLDTEPDPDNTQAPASDVAAGGLDGSLPGEAEAVPISPVPAPSYGNERLLGELVVLDDCTGIVFKQEPDREPGVVFRLDGSTIEANELRYPDSRVLIDGDLVEGKGARTDEAKLIDLGVANFEIGRCQAVISSIVPGSSPELYLAHNWTARP